VFGKRESESKAPPGSGYFKGGTGIKEPPVPGIGKNIRVKEPSVFIIPNPSKNPTGVSLKRTGIFLHGSFIFSKKLRKKQFIYIIRNWVFDFLTTAFIKPKKKDVPF